VSVGKKAVVGWPERLERAKKRAPSTLIYLDSERRRYPVKPGDCQSYKAAYSRAMQQGDRAIAKRAKARAVRLGCDWAVKSEGQG
jgi:hypothetical protein